MTHVPIRRETMRSRPIVLFAIILFFVAGSDLFADSTIDFENAEGNLGIANALINGYADFDGVFHEGALNGVVAPLKLPLTPFTLASPSLGLLLGKEPYAQEHDKIMSDNRTIT